MKAQQYKSLSLRQIFNAALNGQSIDVPARQLFDLPDSTSIDADIIDNDFSDPLEVLQIQIDAIANKHIEKFENDSRKEVSNNETSETQDETSSPLPEK